MAYVDDLARILINAQQAQTAPPPRDTFNPAMQLQLAQAMRQQRAAGATDQPAGGAPLAAHVRQAKQQGTQGTPMQPLDFGDQPQNSNAGTMSIEGKQQSHAMMDWSQRAHDQLQPGEDIHRTASGFTVTGTNGPQQTQAADPRVALIKAYEAKRGSPDPELRAVAGSMTPQQILQHINQQTGEQAKASHESAAAERQARNDTFSQNARRLDEARRLRDELVGKDPMLKSGNPELMRRSPNFEKIQKLDGTIGTLQEQVIGGNEKQQSQSALAWNGHQFSAGQVVKGADGKAYKLTGKLHADGSPEVVPQ